MLAAVNGLLEAVGRSDLRVKRLRIQRQMFCARERELTRGEYKKLVTTAQKRGNNRLSLILQTLCSTGIRIGELRSITRAAAKAGKAVVNNKGKTRIVLLPRRLCGLLVSYCRKRDIESGPVFRTRSGKPIDRSNVWAEMKQLCDWVGVSRDKVFRTTFGTCLRARFTAWKRISAAWRISSATRASRRRRFILYRAARSTNGSSQD